MERNFFFPFEEKNSNSLVKLTPIRTQIEEYIVRPFEYYVRGYFRTAPQLDASIKIYAYDDYTSGSLQRFDLDIEDWATILEKIGEMKPKYIFLDRVWSFPVGKNLK